VSEPPAAEVSLVECKGISKSFPGVHALTEIDFDVVAGEVHALVGENGAGKSTLVKILSGAYQPDSGMLLVNGQRVRLRHRRDADNLGIVTIHQEITLVPELDVATNILLGDAPTFGPKILGDAGMVDRRALYDRARAALAQLHIDIDPHSRAGDLGVPAAQLVLLARGLSRAMKILILDEPTAALTPRERDVLFVQLRRLAKSGVGIIYVSHRLEEIMALADRITVLRDGRAVSTVEGTSSTVDQIVKLMLARSLTDMYPQRERTAELGDVLTVRNLSRAPGRRLRSLDDISLTVRSGEIVGIVGLVGAGKSELAQAISGVDAFDQGEILVEGKLIRIRSPQDALQAGISFAPEDRRRQSLVLTMTLVQNVAVVMANSRKVRASVTLLGEVLNWRRLSKIAQNQIDKFRIRVRHPFQLVRSLSGGNQQKLVLAKCLATSPKVVIFDEPTRGIDVGSKAEIYQIIDGLVQQNLGVLLVSSEIDEVVQMCDRIYVMRKGAIVKEMDHSMANAELILRYAAAGR
jgi:ABC-type sugar transport system ATPase subunit